MGIRLSELEESQAVDLNNDYFFVQNKDTNKKINASSLLQPCMNEINNVSNKVDGIKIPDMSVYVLKSDIIEEIKPYVDYEMFGAIGDGIADDGPAIKQAHEHANANNLPVYANGAKKYYINEASSIPIKTNTNWNGAHFIIAEDHNLTSPVFKIVRKEPEINLDSICSEISINKNTKQITALAGYGNCFVDIRNSEKKQFIRKGANQNSGSDQQDYFRIDNDGNVLNEIQWDFEKVTRVRLYPISEETLIVENGHFTSIENTANVDTGSYTQRGIRCERSNVIIRNCSHKNIKNEAELGSPSSGFFYFWGCCNLLLENCYVEPRYVRYYSEASGKAGTARGTYEIQFSNSTNILMRNVHCSSFDSSRWGCHTSNFTKDVTIENCTLNRVDAHQGVYNISIRNCILGHQGLQMIGGGKLLIDNCIIYANSAVTLRADYGSTWNGPIIMRNIKHIPHAKRDNVRIIKYNNTRDWDFGYDCYMCTDLTIENYVLKDEGIDYSTNVASVPIIVNYNVRNTSGTDVYDYYFPHTIQLKNIKTTSGKGFIIMDGYLDTVSGQFNHSFTTKSDVLEQHPLLDMKCNLFMEITNVELQEISADDYTYYSNNLIRTINLGKDADDNYLGKKNRIVPNIRISQCRNLYLNTLGLPCKLFVENSVIRSLNTMQKGSRSIVCLKDCVVTCSTSSVQKNGSNCILCRFNGKSSSIINTIFHKPKVSEESDLSASSLLTVYPFLSFSTNSSKSACCVVGNYTGCSLVDFSLSDVSSSYANYNILTLDDLKHKYMPLTKGTTNTRPYLSDGAYNGFIYFDTSINKPIIFMGNSWYDFNGNIV